MCDKPAGNKLFAIIQSKCPRCRRGKVFTNSGFNLAKYTKMNDNCPICGLHFELEPGYFYSAMFISYMITCMMCIYTGIAVYFLLNNPEAWVYSTIIISFMILISPFSFRYSRILTIHFISPIRFDRHWK